MPFRFLILFRYIITILILFSFLLIPGLGAEEDPALPDGLITSEEEAEPSLPSGLVSPSSSDEPLLPAGLGNDSTSSTEPDLPSGLDFDPPSSDSEPIMPQGLNAPEQVSAPSLPVFGNETESTKNDYTKSFRESLPFTISGFWEALYGRRLQNDPFQKDYSAAETRFQFAAEKLTNRVSFQLKADFLYDWVIDDHDVNLEEGKGFIDLREANLLFRPGDSVDLKIGRQILTWGTGDLLFINDLFPKDWHAFFIGRDDEYLKAPSDAVTLSFFSNILKLDIIYSPRFDANRYIDGTRISYYNPMEGGVSGTEVNAYRPGDWFKDDEVYLRLYRNLWSTEFALYGYKGFWKDPVGFDPSIGKSTFPGLSVFGGSARRAIGKGIGNIELGWYNSEDDCSGEDPFVPNSEFRFLIGYEQEIAKEFTASIQYYLEHMIEYDDYEQNLPEGMHQRDENRHLLTVRLTKLLMNQNLILSLFTYYSPSDEDWYLRPKGLYKITDAWSFETGGNIFTGKNIYTFFGQFEDATNWYARIRWSY